MIYHSQFGEDEWLDAQNILPPIGVFVDVGAGAPIFASNTYCFEQRGWKGLCIDAEERHIPDLKTHRANVEHCFVGTSQGYAVLQRAGCPELSTVLDHLPLEDRLPAIRLPVIDLESLVNLHGIDKIDLLSIDTEGTEIDVLNSLDLESHAPEVIIVEFLTQPRPSNETALLEYFSDLPYDLIHKTFANLILKRRS